AGCTLQAYLSFWVKRFNSRTAEITGPSRGYLPFWVKRNSIGATIARPEISVSKSSIAAGGLANPTLPWLACGPRWVVRRFSAMGARVGADDLLQRLLIQFVPPALPAHDPIAADDHAMGTRVDAS